MQQGTPRASHRSTMRDAARRAAAWVVVTASVATADIESLPLGAPAEATPIGDASAGGPDPFSFGSYLQTLLALAIVVALMVLLAAVFKKISGKRGGLIGGMGPGGPAPSGVLEILGRYPIASGQTLVLLRFDRRVVLAHQASGRKGAGMTTLSEVTDPEEVASIMLKTRNPADERADGSFREAIRNMERGFDPTGASPAPVGQGDATQTQASLDLLVGEHSAQPASAIRSRLRAWAGAS